MPLVLLLAQVFFGLSLQVLLELRVGRVGAGLRPVTPAEATAWLDSLVASGKPDETVFNQTVAVLSRRMPEESKMEAVVERIALRVATFVTEQILSSTDNTNLGVLLQGFVLKS